MMTLLIGLITVLLVLDCILLILLVLVLFGGVGYGRR